MTEEILRLLEENARLSEKEIAVMLGLTEKQVNDVIKAAEKQQFICGYKTLVNWEKAGRNHVSAIIELKVTPKPDLGFDEIAGRIMQFPEVESLFLMSGGYDLSVTVTGKDFKDIAFFVAKKLSQMESVVSTATHFLLKKYKDHGAMVEHTETDERGYNAL